MEQTEQRVILFIDDLASNLMAVQLMLEAEEYVVQTATSGSKAFEWLETSIQLPSLILCDVMMPDQSGFEVCRQLNNDSRYKDIPVIFVTARITQNDILEGFESGGVDYITKPFNNMELAARVKNHIELSENRKKLELQNKQLEEANRVKSVLFDVIDHDIRTPIEGFMNLTEMMYKQPSHFSIETVKQLSSEMYQSSQRLNQMVENLLNWGKVQLNGFEIIPSTINVKNKVVEIIELFNTIAIKKKIKFSVSIASVLKIEADEEMFATILRNVILNALQHANVSSTVTIIGGKTNPDYITISIRDEGVGMSNEIVKAIENRTVLSTTLESVADSALGIGLGIMQNFVELHKGTFSITTEPNVGSTIMITLPTEIRQLHSTVS
ncbi:MAG: hybrid sensor histidine kinase/response regulator [Candidatus Kapabacteria bacterium]|nr:hybrid sensor histidine kinase/response regulator [Candidatus Kapabacteria bacterium]